MAAAVGCSIRLTLFAPAARAASSTASSFDCGDRGRDADEHPGATEAGDPGALEQELDHPLGDVEVGDGAFAQGPHRHDVARGAPDHLPGLTAHVEHRVGAAVQGDNRWLVQDNAASFCIDERVGGTQVYREIPRHPRSLLSLPGRHVLLVLLPGRYVPRPDGPGRRAVGRCHSLQRAGELGHAVFHRFRPARNHDDYRDGHGCHDCRPGDPSQGPPLDRCMAVVAGHKQLQPCGPQLPNWLIASDRPRSNVARLSRQRGARRAPKRCRPPRFRASKSGLPPLSHLCQSAQHRKPQACGEQKLRLRPRPRKARVNRCGAPAQPYLQTATACAGLGRSTPSCPELHGVRLVLERDDPGPAFSVLADGPRENDHGAAAGDDGPRRQAFEREARPTGRPRSSPAGGSDTGQ